MVLLIFTLYISVVFFIRVQVNTSHFSRIEFLLLCDIDFNLSLKTFSLNAYKHKAAFIVWVMSRNFARSCAVKWYYGCD